jgi:CRISPR-associated protein Cas2
MSAARIRYLVSYDICHPKRLRRVAKVLEGYGVRLQYSVFECPLDEMRLAQAKAALHELINHDEDQVLFVSLGPSANDASLIIEAMGLPYQVRTRVTII